MFDNKHSIKINLECLVNSLYFVNIQKRLLIKFFIIYIFIYINNCKMMKKGFVYLICDNKNELFKIGVTKKTIDKRIKELQTGNSTELFISKYHESDYPYMIENMLHNHFKVNNVLNEWFELTSEDVINFNDICNELEYRIEVLKDNPFFKKKLK